MMSAISKGPAASLGMTSLVEGLLCLKPYHNQRRFG